MTDSLVWQVQERRDRKRKRNEKEKKGGGQSRSDTAVIRGQSSIANSITGRYLHKYGIDWARFRIMNSQSREFGVN